MLYFYIVAISDCCLGKMQRTDYIEDNWLAASDFTEAGQTLTIDRVELKEIAPSREKLVVFFKDEEKGFVLNVVNENTIAKNIGTTETDDWSGYKIALYSTEIKMRGEQVPCIRVKILVDEFSAKE